LVVRAALALSPREEMIDMSRAIDFSEPLSEADAQYVQDRPWMLADAEMRGIEVQYAGDDFIDGSEDADAIAAAQAAQAAADASDDDESEPVDYSTWIKKDLIAEIERRNGELDEDDEEIAPESERNEDLIAALVADDEARAEDSDDDE
jgi:hypothetical protein